jgi:hypothetical protein
VEESKIWETEWRNMRVGLFLPACGVPPFYGLDPLTSRYGFQRSFVVAELKLTTSCRF